MAKALGQLPNAPLIYVLAQIRFTHIPRMDRRWEGRGQFSCCNIPATDVDYSPWHGPFVLNFPAPFIT